MCRLGGFIKLDKFKNEDNEWLKDVSMNMLISMESGGKDATGFGTVIDGEVVVKKKDVRASKFIEQEEMNFLYNNIHKMKFCSFHTRASTMGTPKDNKNNHPIYSKTTNSFITHNGVISNHKYVRDVEQLTTDGEVDSEVIIKMLEKYNFNFEQALSKLMGSFAIVVYKDNKLYFVKHTNNITFALVPEKNVILYATTEEIIKDGLEEWIIGIFFKRKVEYIKREMFNDELIIVDLNKSSSDIDFMTEKYLLLTNKNNDVKINDNWKYETNNYNFNMNDATINELHYIDEEYHTEISDYGKIGLKIKTINMFYEHGLQNKLKEIKDMYSYLYVSTENKVLKNIKIFFKNEDKKKKAIKILTNVFNDLIIKAELNKDDFAKDVAYELTVLMDYDEKSLITTITGDKNE